MMRAPRSSPLFPYTTLFRSGDCLEPQADGAAVEEPADRRADLLNRSEEHTSELQSHVNLVCRLLLEKKKSCDDHRSSAHSDCRDPASAATAASFHRLPDEAP